MPQPPNVYMLRSMEIKARSECKSCGKARLYEVLELLGPQSLSELHLKMLQQDFDDGLLERKIRKITGRL